jgi:hypothetical protein
MVTRSSGSSSPSARPSDRPAPGRPVRLIGATLLLALAACDSSTLGGDDDDDTSHVRAINLLSDAGPVQFRLDTASVATPDFRAMTPFVAARTGNMAVSLHAQEPRALADDDDDDDDDDSTIPIGQPVNQAFANERDYTLIAFGTVASPQLTVIPADNHRDDVDDNEVTWQAVHAAPGSPAIDIYLTAPEAGIDTPQLSGTVGLTQHTTDRTLTLEQPPDEDEDTQRVADVTLELRESGTANVLFRSEVRIAEQTRLLLVFGDNDGPGPSGLVVMPFGSATTLVRDANETANIRFVHLGADVPMLDVHSVRSGSGLSIPFADDVSFRGVTTPAAIPVGETNLLAVPSDNPGVFVFLEEFTAAGAGSYTAYGVGKLADIDALVVLDGRRGIATETRFRVLHAAPSLGDDEGFDFYVTRRGEPVDFGEDDEDDDGDQPFFASVVYRAVGTYTPLEEGAYDLHVYLEDTETRTAGPFPIQFTKGENVTLVLENDEAGSLEMQVYNDAS